MHKKHAVGTWLHRMKKQTARTRVRGEKERELKWLAVKWEDQEVPFDEVIGRIEDLRRSGGAR